MTTHRRMPHTRYPRNLEDAYRRRIVRLVYQWRQVAMEYFNVYMKDYFKGGTQIVGDAPKKNNPTETEQQNVLHNLDAMGYTIKQATSDATIRKIAEQFVRTIDMFSYNNVAMQIRIAGINPIRDSPELTKMFNARVAENVQLIKYMKDRYADSITGVISRAISNGDGTGAITKEIVKQTGMSVRHAALVANDQTGSALAKFNESRHKAAGAKDYVWQSMEDNRVRPKHQELDGTRQTYDDPTGGDDGQMPGEPINCRCVASPVFSFY